jgi:hypothetical protein
MYANYRNIPYLISYKRPFKGNSVKALIKNDNHYEVYSYREKILELDENKRVIMFNNHYFSPTTSRIQNIIARIYDYPTKRSNEIYPISYSLFKDE